MDFGERSDNPFAVPLGRKNPSRRKALVSAAKFLVVVAIALGVTLVVSTQSQRWLAYQLTNNFDTLPAKEKSLRLVQIAELGALGIEPLVGAMVDEDVEVARTAYEMLRKTQNEWTVLEGQQRMQRHQLLVESLRAIALDVPDDRTGWGTSLLQQTMVAAIDREEQQSRELYDRATQAMKLYALTDRPGQSVIPDDSMSGSPRRLTVTSEPLPVARASFLDEWNHRAPAQETSARIAASGPASQPTSPQVETTAIPVASPPPTQKVASVYKSTAHRLQDVNTQEGDGLNELATFESSRRQDGIQTVTHLVDSPMTTFADVSVMRWLGSPHQALREKAKLELISRGFDDTAITIATRIAVGDVPTKLALVDALAGAAEVDPRPWLLMLLQDESRDVKLKVVSVLGTMNDPEITGKLQMHLVDESDPTVVARIRRVLKLR